MLGVKKMAEELAKAMDKLADIITARVVAAGEKAAEENAAARATAVVPHAEMVQKLELSPNEVKLEGVENYLRWSRRGRLILRTKSLEGYVLGEVQEPGDKKGEEWRKWSVTDSLVMNWLLNSLTSSVAASVEDLPNSNEVWTALSSMYSGKGNFMLVSKIEDAVHDLTQGDKSVMVYVEELKHLWADLDYLAPLVLPDAESAVIAKKWVEDRRVMKFLKGLNPAFEGRRAILMHQAQLSSLGEAIAAIAQEETRLKASGGLEMTQKPTYLVANKPENRDCYNCGLVGHLSHQCTAPKRARGYNRGDGRGNYRGDGRGYYRGGGRGRSAPYSYNNYNRYQAVGARANVSVACEGQPGTSQSQERGSQERKNEQQGQGRKTDQQAEAFGQFAHFVYTEEGNETASVVVHKTGVEWVLDSGASKHVTGSINEFECYQLYSQPHRETIQTADGTAQPIKGVGAVQCTPSIKLKSVLHVPAFPVNLVSLSALIDQLDCYITLDKKRCLIQETGTGRRIGAGTRHRGLWYMDRQELEGTAGAVYTATATEKEANAMIHHCRFGHVSFE